MAGAAYNPDVDHDFDAAVQAGYSVTRVNVLSSTQIAARTTAIIDKLSTPSSSTAVFRLSARAKAANKLISIVDISRRELAARGVQIFQYNALSSIVTEIPRNRQTGKNDDANDDDDGEFETMGAADSGMKQRKVPVMTIYLSRVPVKELRTALGEQRIPSAVA